MCINRHVHAANTQTCTVPTIHCHHHLFPEVEPNRMDQVISFLKKNNEHIEVAAQLCQDVQIQGRSSQCHCESCSVVSDSLQPHRLYSPLNSQRQNTGVGSLSLL